MSEVQATSSETLTGRSSPAWGETVCRLVEGAVGAVNFLVLIALTLVVFTGVIARYIFNSGFSWTEEFSIWAFTWLIFLGAATGIRQKRHVHVDLLVDHLPASARPAVDFLRDSLVALTLLLFTFSGYELADRIGGVSTTLQWPNALRYGVVPAAGGIGLLFLLLGETTMAGLLRRAGSILLAGAMYLVVQDQALSPFQDVSPSLLMTLVFFLTMLIGVPIAFCMMLGVFVTTWSADLLPAPAILQNMIAGSTKFILLAIPFFLTSGYLLNLGRLSERLIDFAESLFGHFRGGLAQVVVVNSVLIGGISGSSGADAASTTKVAVPEMIKRGYSPAFSCAITAVSSILPNIIPPAIAMLVYASVSNVSISRLFAAGIIPGLLVAIALMSVVYILSVRRGYEGGKRRAPASVVWRTFLQAAPTLAIAVLILGCIRLGITTATEAGVMALVWAFILGKFVYRAYGWRSFYRAIIDCATDSALIGFLIATSVPFAWILIAEGVPQELIGWARETAQGQFGLLLIMNLTLFVAGMFLDLTPAMLIAAPLFLPLMTQAGIDPIQLGLIMIINLQLGGVTPPVGILVFISAQIAKVQPYAVFREVAVFVAAVLVVLAAVCAFPFLTVGIWDVFG